MSRNNIQTSGVQELVDRLRQDGVTEGRKEAERLLEEARRKAAEILEAAQREAAAIREDAEKASKRLQAAGEDGLRLAVRDSLLRLRTEIEDRFVAHLGRLVSGKLRDPEFFERLLLSIAGRAAPRDQPVDILMPEKIRRGADEAGQEQASQADSFVRGLTSDMLREGVTLATSGDLEAGLVARLADEGLEVQLDEQTLKELLGRHLLPRFRSLLEATSGDAEGADDRE
jgi:V/A-type H+-transporting ATPase subunit E